MQHILAGFAARIAPIEQIFRDVAMMKPEPHKDEDPYQSEEYAKFVASMVKYCRCTPESNRPCDGVLAGGMCDDMHSDRDCAEREWDCDED